MQRDGTNITVVSATVAIDANGIRLTPSAAVLASFEEANAYKRALTVRQ
jgi:hypothetical protein